MDQKTKNARQFIEAMPHAKALGLTVEEIADGRAKIRMPYQADLIGDPDTKVIHGGAVFALMDTCCGTAVMTDPGVAGVAATLDLRIDYMRSARPGQTITAVAECYNVTRTIAFVRATAFDEDLERPVATANGAFTVET